MHACIRACVRACVRACLHILTTLNSFCVQSRHTLSECGSDRFCMYNLYSSYIKKKPSCAGENFLEVEQFEIAQLYLHKLA